MPRPVAPQFGRVPSAVWRKPGCCICGAANPPYGIGSPGTKGTLDTTRWYCADHYQITPPGQARIWDKLTMALNDQGE
jgi:hypothetical protein